MLGNDLLESTGFFWSNTAAGAALNEICGSDLIRLERNPDISGLLVSRNASEDALPQKSPAGEIAARMP
jgi:hypothetical protein